MGAKEKSAIARKMKEIVMDIQDFVDSASTEAAESEEMETLLQAQSDLSDAFEELTGKSIY